MITMRQWRIGEKVAASLLRRAYLLKESIMPGVLLHERVPGWKAVHDWMRGRCDGRVATVFGRKIELDPLDVNEVRFGAPACQPVVKFLCRRVKIGDAAIDVGANIGYFTILLADLTCRPHGHVVGLEPDPQMFAILSRNVRDLGNAWVAQVAAGAEVGELPWYRNPDCGGDHSLVPGHGRVESGTVAVRPLDHLPITTRGRLWIKVDVQGYERSVLLGAKQHMENGAVMVMEWWPHGLRLAGTDPEAFLSWLRREHLVALLPSLSEDVPLSFSHIGGCCDVVVVRKGKEEGVL